jgi:uncharacterized protein DUF3105
MADRKAEKERLRQERLKAEKRERAEQRRNMLLGYGVAGALTLLVLAGIVYVIAKSGGGGVSEGAHISVDSGSTFGLKPDEREGPAPPEQQEFDLADAAQAAGCVLREDLPEEGHRHLAEGESPPDYKTNPPTSGDHSPNPLADGAYLDAPEPVNYVHSMEHGRVLIQYDPKLPEKQQLELRGLFDELYSGALMFPNPDLPYAVAAVAWANYLGCKQYEGAATLDAIRAFGEEHWGEGPEPSDAFGPLTGPTPATPGQDPPDS